MRRATRRGRVAMLVVALAACGSGYEAENLAIVERFPELDGAAPVSIESNGYCTGDRCLFGDDGTSTLVIYEVDAPTGDEAIVAEFAAAFPDWEVRSERICLSAADEGCQELVLTASITGDEAWFGFNFDNWPLGFEIYVDAHPSGG